jgi:hypothetical protein
MKKFLPHTTHLGRKHNDTQNHLPSTLFSTELGSIHTSGFTYADSKAQLLSSGVHMSGETPPTSPLVTTPPIPPTHTA